MANQKLFGNSGSSRRRVVPPPTTVNEAGGAAYAMPDWHALCQLAMTGFFNNVVYIAATDQLNFLLEKTKNFPAEKVIRLACASRQRGYLKDMGPALLLSVYRRDRALAHRAFPIIVDADKPFRAMFSMVMSGQFGMKDVGYALKRDFERVLHSWSPEKLVSLSIGQGNPSFRDMFRVIHPRPRNLTERALWGYLLNNDESRWGQGASFEHLPPAIQALIRYDRAENEELQLALVPELTRFRWERLNGNARGLEVRKAIVRYLKPQALRMNLRAISEKGVFNDPEMVNLVISKLVDADAIAKSRQFGYQYLTAYTACQGRVPVEILGALHKAADIACGNVPAMPGPVAVLVDVSGSMASNPVTGFKDSNQTTSRSIDVASLMGVSIWRKTRGSVLIPVDTQVHRHTFDPAQSLLTISAQLARYGGGGTSLSEGINYLNTNMRNQPFAGIVLISDNESWADKPGSSVMSTFRRFQDNQNRIGVYRNPKMICVDLCPNRSTPATETIDVMNIGGYTDAVFEMIEAFMSGDNTRFSDYIDRFEL